jgi:hypothetical protein
LEPVGCVTDDESVICRVSPAIRAIAAQRPNGGVIRRIIRISVVVKATVALMMSSEIDIES